MACVAWRQSVGDWAVLSPAAQFQHQVTVAVGAKGSWPRKRRVFAQQLLEGRDTDGQEGSCLWLVQVERLNAKELLVCGHWAGARHSSKLQAFEHRVKRRNDLQTVVGCMADRGDDFWTRNVAVVSAAVEPCLEFVAELPHLRIVQVLGRLDGVNQDGRSLGWLSLSPDD